MSGGIWPGMAAAGTPGVNPGPCAFGSEVATSGGGYSGPPNGPVVKFEHGSGSPGLGRPSIGGVYEHGEPLSTPGPGFSGVPSSTAGPGAGAPFGNRAPFGSGNRQAGRPALRQNSSGSIPRLLNAASTNGCKIWYGSRFANSTLKNGPEETASPRDATNLATVDSVSIRSNLRSRRTSLTVRSCSNTWLRFGLSSMKPFTCSEKAATRSNNMLTAY